VLEPRWKTGAIIAILTVFC